MKIPFGLKEDKLWFVTEVANGNSCGCVCPKCKHPLQARNNPGNYKRPYFAHVARSDCVYNGMTDVHRMAQQVLLDEKNVLLPVFQALPRVDLLDGEWLEGEEVVLAAKRFEAESSLLEFSENEYIADVVFACAGKELLIEIAVTHFVNDSKRQKVVGANRAMIEIDLSSVEPDLIFDYKKFRALVLNPRDRATWINNPKGNFLVAQQLAKLEEKKVKLNLAIQTEQAERKKRAAVEQAQRKKQQSIERASKASLEHRRQKERSKIKIELELLEAARTLEWQSKRREELRAQRGNHFEIEETQRVYELPSVDVETYGDWIFEADRSDWQALVVGLLIGSSEDNRLPVNEIKKRVVREFGVLPFMERLNILKQQEKEKGRERGKGYAKYGCWFLERHENAAIISPFLPVSKYVDYLCTIQFAMKNAESCYSNFKSTDEYARALIEQEFQRRQDEERREALDQLSFEDRNRAKEQRRLRIKYRGRCLAAADERLLREADGEGKRCHQCRMSHFLTELCCPFCNSAESEPRLLTENEFVNVYNRYRSGSIPRESVMNCEALDLACVEKYLD